MNNTTSLVSYTDLHDFNTKLELLFLEILNPPYIYLITSKVSFLKGLANLHNMSLTSLTYVLTISPFDNP